MKELIIQIQIDGNQTVTVMKRHGFEENVSSNYEVMGILQNLIKIEQDKMDAKGTTITQTKDGEKEL